MNRLVLILALLLSALAVRAQEFQHAWSYRAVSAQRYFRCNYENDLPFGTDRYFTQGVHFEWLSPGLGRLPVRHLLLHPRHSLTRIGMALESAGYTSSVITADSILYGDRPFAGMAYVKAFSISLDTIRRLRFSTTLTVGLMGPAAGGYEIQSWIHRQTGNPEPTGWKYQVGNMPIINYELTAEKLLYQRRRIMLTGTGMLRAGTYNVKAAVGGALLAGWLEDPFQARQRRQGQLYLFVHPRVDFVGYDASLQGSPFADNSPYTINSREMLRTVFRCDGGFRFVYGRIGGGLYLRYLTKEFGTGLNHALGGIELAIGL